MAAFANMYYGNYKKIALGEYPPLQVKLVIFLYVNKQKINQFLAGN